VKHCPKWRRQQISKNKTALAEATESSGERAEQSEKIDGGRGSRSALTEGTTGGIWRRARRSELRNRAAPSLLRGGWRRRCVRRGGGGAAPVSLRRSFGGWEGRPPLGDFFCASSSGEDEALQISLRAAVRACDRPPELRASPWLAFSPPWSPNARAGPTQDMLTARRRIFPSNGIPSCPLLLACPGY
jgi:hypothetical protein